MIVISKDQDRIADCSEIILDGNKIVGYITACQGCSFIIGEYKDEGEAKRAFFHAMIAVSNPNKPLNFDAF